MAVDGAKLTGFKYDVTNSYLEVWVRGTNCARFDDATADLTLITNGLTVDSGGITVDTGAITVADATNSTSTVTGCIHTDGGFGIAGATFIGGSLVVTDVVTYDGEIYHAGEPTETATAAKTLDAEDVAKIMKCDSDDTVYTLPATAAGLTFTILNTCSAGGCKMSFSPHTNDMIMGIDVTGSDGKDLINTKSTQATGDMCTVVGDGSIGWYIKEVHGTWAREA